LAVSRREPGTGMVLLRDSKWRGIMPEQPSPTQSRAEKMTATITDQVNDITKAFAEAEDDADWADIKVDRSGGGVGFMYAEGQILVRSEYLGEVQKTLQGRGYRLGGTEPVVLGVVLQYLTPRNGKRAGKYVSSAKTPYQVIEALDAIETEVGEDVATPDQVLTVSNGSGEVGPCPATEPEMVYDDIEPRPGVCWGNSGAGVRIYVADTGLLQGAATEHPWLQGVTGDPDDLPPKTAGVQWIPHYAGHGTFVAGVARCLAPQAEVHVAKVFKHKLGGSALEHHFVRRLRAALRGSYDIFHVTASSPTRYNRPLLAFEAWLKLLSQYHGAVCVAPAGNSGSSRLSWPAAFSGVVSVGALAADGRDRAGFSNYGGWVDVYAPGRDLINAYATGAYKCRVAPYKGEDRVFYGMAKWSGTSFSTPIVTGLIAARMSRTGEGGRQAADALVAEAQSQAIPDVGAILLPCDGWAGGGPACRAECCGTHRCRMGPC
jgi:hypothetical protein